MPCEAEPAVRKGPWTMEEDLVLANYVAAHGEGAWNSLARAAGLNRTGKSCRLRWLNYLRPDVRRGNITAEEHVLIVELQARWGNRWSKIARHLPGRTDNEIKNFWRTKIQKKQQQHRDTAASSDSAGFCQLPSTAAPAAVAESQSSSTSTVGWAGAMPHYDVFTPARHPVGFGDHQLGYAVQGEGGAAACAGGVESGVPPEFLQAGVPQEFLQAAAAAAVAGDNFWGLEEFWPTVPSLHGDC